MNRVFSIVIAFCCLLLPGAASFAQEAFPTKPVQLIVHFPTGGVQDIVSRRLAEKFREDWGQPVLVINKPGANGVVAWQYLLTTKPDGYNVFAVAGEGLGFVQLMNSSISSRFVDQFTPVASYASYPLVFLVHKDLPVTNLRELAAHAKKNPQALSYGTTGVGSGGHFLFELFKSAAGVSEASLPAIHYAGIAPEITALVANQIQVAIMPLTSIAAAQIDAGSIRALAVTASNRSRFRKEIATVTEQGYPALVAKDYLSYWVTAKTPASVVRKLADATRSATENSEMRKKIEDLYLEVEYLDGPDVLKQFEIRASQFEPLIKKLNIKVQ